jgi:hypothetical protein
MCACIVQVFAFVRVSVYALCKCIRVSVHMVLSYLYDLEGRNQDLCLCLLMYKLTHEMALIAQS